MDTHKIETLFLGHIVCSVHCAAGRLRRAIARLLPRPRKRERLKRNMWLIFVIPPTFAL